MARKRSHLLEGISRDPLLVVFMQLTQPYCLPSVGSLIGANQRDSLVEPCRQIRAVLIVRPPPPPPPPLGATTGVCNRHPAVRRQNTAYRCALGAGGGGRLQQRLEARCSGQLFVFHWVQQ